METKMTKEVMHPDVFKQLEKEINKAFLLVLENEPYLIRELFPTAIYVEYTQRYSVWQSELNKLYNKLEKIEFNSMDWYTMSYIKRYRFKVDKRRTYLMGVDREYIKISITITFKHIGDAIV